ncbi:hypothetical protein BT69DRAFT_1278316 [Atractiella rhizophila]|nr:hypothetical protein BT69DRAFT_1278316 [Atractiella rhizophila]
MVPSEWERWYDCRNSDVEGMLKNLSRGEVKPDAPASLKAFTTRCREFSLPRKPNGKPLLSWEIDGKGIKATSSSHSISITSKTFTGGLPHGMSPKKAREVDRFTALAQMLLSNEPQIKSAIDIGAGRAHLSAALTREPLLLDVCAIEGSSSQVTGAEKLVSNRLKYKKEEEEKRGMLTLKTEVLNENGIRKILQEGRAEKEEGRLVCALHACGDLTVDTLRAFVSSGSAERQDVLIAIGCCYNLTSSTNFPFHPSNISPTFAHNHLVLATQSPILWASSTSSWEAAKLSMRKLVYRARLQVELDASQGPSPSENRVGRLADSCFLSYEIFRSKALKKMHLNENDVARLEPQGDWEGFEKKFMFFWSLRCLLGPVLESYIVLERYTGLALLLQERLAVDENASRELRLELLNLFDQEESGSARNLAIVVH